MKLIKVKNVIEVLKTLPQDGTFLVSCDEELNTLYKEFQIGELGNNKFVIYGLSGTEVDL